MKTPLSHRLYLWLSAWLYLLDGIVGIVTLGFYNPYLSFKSIYWFAKKNLREHENN